MPLWAERVSQSGEEHAKKWAGDGKGLWSYPLENLVLAKIFNRPTWGPIRILVSTRGADSRPRIWF
jgi:hypothetical protein